MKFEEFFTEAVTQNRIQRNTSVQSIERGLVDPKRSDKIKTTYNRVHAAINKAPKLTPNHCFYSDKTTFFAINLTKANDALLKIYNRYVDVKDKSIHGFDGDHFKDMMSELLEYNDTIVAASVDMSADTYPGLGKALDVGMASVKRTEQGQGIMLELYKHLILVEGRTLVSDNQSAGAIKMWMRLHDVKGIDVFGYASGRRWPLVTDHKGFLFTNYLHDDDTPHYIVARKA